MGMNTSREQEILNSIHSLVEEYCTLVHSPKPFIPGTTPVRYAGRVFGSEEVNNAVTASLQFWLTYGPFEKEYKEQFRTIMNDRHVILTNSGSSANLLAISALTSKRLEERLHPGDEVITVAAGFPTTVAPILQNSLVPVFVDVELGHYNINAHSLPEALSTKTRAIMIAHTLGIPFDIDSIVSFAKENNLYLVEDTCDALGSTWDGKLLGTFGDISTFSHYPPHHITMGEGGTVTTNSGRLKREIESFRDWGRDCWCDTGKNNTCGKRFGWKLGSLPEGYDHKYVYGNIGYNLKGTDFGPAIGLAQLKRLPHFTQRRKENATLYSERLQQYQEFLQLPSTHPKADPSWFAYPITVHEQ